jgi:hypothetical protein
MGRARTAMEKQPLRRAGRSGPITVIGRPLSLTGMLVFFLTILAGLELRYSTFSALL